MPLEIPSLETLRNEMHQNESELVQIMPIKTPLGVEMTHSVIESEKNAHLHAL